MNFLFAGHGLNIILILWVKATFFRNASAGSFSSKLKGTFIKTRSIRPISAPNEYIMKQKDKKKHSLPSIFTAISKSVRPKHYHSNSTVDRGAIHKGSYQIIPKLSKGEHIEFPASCQTAQQHMKPSVTTPRNEKTVNMRSLRTCYTSVKAFNTNKEQNNKKKSIVIRTSIE